VDELLEAWKHGEELLPVLPPLGSDHETVGTAVADLRAIYVALVNRGGPPKPPVEIFTPTIHGAIRAIGEVLDRTRTATLTV